MKNDFRKYKCVVTPDFMPLFRMTEKYESKKYVLTLEKDEYFLGEVDSNNQYSSIYIMEKEIIIDEDRIRTITLTSEEVKQIEQRCEFIGFGVLKYNKPRNFPLHLCFGYRGVT